MFAHAGAQQATFCHLLLKDCKKKKQPRFDAFRILRAGGLDSISFNEKVPFFCVETLFIQFVFQPCS